LHTPHEIQSFLSIVAQARARTALGTGTARTLRARGRLLLSGTKTLKATSAAGSGSRRRLLASVLAGFLDRILDRIDEEVPVRHRRAIPIALLAALVAAPAHALDFRDRFSATAARIGLQGGGAFDALGDEIADTAARNLPVIAASAGFTYRYNPQLEVFERTSDTLGPLFLERPDTLG